MKNSYQYGFRFVVTLFLLMVLTGCGDSNKTKWLSLLEHDYSQASRGLSSLESDLKAGRLVNAGIVSSYGNSLIRTKPDLQDVVKSLKLEATIEGASYGFIKKRFLNAGKELEALKKNFHETDAINLNKEINSIIYASQSNTFNDSLLDVINTLADLSGGELSRINIPRLEKDDSAASSMGPGSHLIGNPSYGQWETDNSGHSFWAWYGMYRMFDDVLSGGSRGRNRTVYWDDYERNRGWTYYGDVGRKSYGTRDDSTFYSKKYNALPASDKAKVNTKKSFGDIKIKRVSSFSKTSAQSQVSKNSPSTPKTLSTKRPSAFGKPSKTSKPASSNSSFRSSSFKSSGSSRGSK